MRPDQFDEPIDAPDRDPDPVIRLIPIQGRVNAELLAEDLDQSQLIF